MGTNAPNFVSSVCVPVPPVHMFLTLGVMARTVGTILGEGAADGPLGVMVSENSSIMGWTGHLVTDVPSGPTLGRAGEILMSVTSTGVVTSSPMGAVLRCMTALAPAGGSVTGHSP